MRKLLKYLKNYKLQSVLAPLFKFVEACFELFIPVIVASVVDEGIAGGRGAGYIVCACALLIALGLAGLVASVAAQYFAARAAVGFSKELRRDLFKKMQSLPYSGIDGLGTHKMITRMTSDVNQIQSGVNLVLRLFMRSPFIVFGAMVMSFTISVRAGGIVAISIGVLFIVVFAVMFVCVPLYKKSRSGLDRVTLSTRESLTGARVIRAFCKEEEEVSEFGRRNSGLKKSQLFVGKIAALMNPLTFAVVNVAIIALLYSGGRGFLTRGKVIALYNYMAQILTELIKLANLIVTVTKSFASAGRVAEILDMDSAAGAAETAANDGVLKGEGARVQFKNVCANYNGAAVNALDGISFTAESGQTVGIIGGTGAGKTTLVNMIPHFYDAVSGEILIDGVNVNAIGDEKLRNACGIVPQRAVLFSGTLRDNMLWGKKDASDTEIMEAVKFAAAGDVVASKPGGLNAAVEQGGKNFSGGQRQRLTIARALVKKPKILILDDSASALDYATEAKLRSSLASLGYHPTVFIVSQRTSSIRHADLILVLDGGKLLGAGTHEQLLASCQTYREIHFSQLSGEGAK